MYSKPQLQITTPCANPTSFTPALLGFNPQSKVLQRRFPGCM